MAAHHGSPWAQKWQQQRAARWELQVEELPQEGDGLPCPWGLSHLVWSLHLWQNFVQMVSLGLESPVTQKCP